MNAAIFEQEVAQREPLEKPMPALQMTLSSAASQPVDADLQLIGPYLRNEARALLSVMTPGDLSLLAHISYLPAEKLEGVLAADSGNHTADKKRRSTGKESEPGVQSHLEVSVMHCVL